MLSLILIKKIASLLIIMLLGAISVRAKILRPTDSQVLSAFSLWIIGPCVILSSLQIEKSPEIIKGLLVAFIAAIAVHGLFILVAGLFGKPLKLSRAEKACIAYPNCGNMVIPLTTAMFGSDKVLYVIPFICASSILQWTHLYSMIRNEKPKIKTIITNVYIISIAVGLLLFILNIRFPYFLQDTIKSVGDMIGPVSMFITGMLLGSQNLKKLFLTPRAYAISAGRLIFMPLVALLFYKLLKLENYAPDATIMLISFLSCITCSASTVTQMADLYTDDGTYVATINILTTVLCIVTAPIMVELFQIWNI